MNETRIDTLESLIKSSIREYEKVDAIVDVKFSTSGVLRGNRNNDIWNCSQICII